MEVGDFHIKYLGVPLMGTRIVVAHYQPLVDMIVQCFKSWEVR